MDMPQLDLDGGSGTRPERPGEEPVKCWDEIEYAPDMLAALANASLRGLAEEYAFLIDDGGSLRSVKGRQFRQIMKDRSLTIADLQAAL